MHNAICIRPEIDADIRIIGEITEAAFREMAISQHTEQFIVAALRAAGALTLSLVAVLEGSVVGHIAFSPVTMSDGTQRWYGLGPVSVVPELQRQGIGGALIREGLTQLRTLGARGCCLVGHPEYYRRFEFQNTDRLTYEGVPREVFFVLPFNGCIPEGYVEFHPGFSAVS